ncbi:type 1 glutamine amidotransferase [Actinomadura graeca]|uniref:Type 1 glutamine amidotransferase n=1 Tax=Actinomadura graeca TaxID=2750812 RepID=A0ABX8R5U6_9ACTN|nr:type 1 glutamine amidotransferase [Actinomadura graeca]
MGVLVENQYQEIEFWYPVLRFREMGANVIVIGPSADAVYGSKLGHPVRPEFAVGDVRPEDLDAVLIPGGFAPEALRRNAGVLDLVRAVHDRGAVVGAVCHAGWVLASAGLAKGRRLTSVSVIRDDMVNAGAQYLEDAVVRDGNLVTARLPNDVGSWCREIHAAIEDLPARPARSRPLTPTRRVSAVYDLPVRVKQRAVAPGSANYTQYAAAGEPA